MRYWAVDDRVLESDRETIFLKSGRKVWIKEGDALIFFARKVDELLFYTKGIVALTSLEEIEEGGFLFKAKISRSAEFEEARKLDDFAFSLSKIYRYLKPYLHFRRPYVELSKDDFRAIFEGNIYWSRTAFGLFINQLPRPQIIKFFKLIADFQPDFFFEESGYKSVWENLNRFIKEDTAVRLILK